MSQANHHPNSKIYPANLHLFDCSCKFFIRNCFDRATRYNATFGFVGTKLVASR